jgi:hypothetical protein
MISVRPQRELKVAWIMQTGKVACRRRSRLLLRARTGLLAGPPDLQRVPPTGSAWPPV